MQVNLIGLDKIWTRESIDKGRSTKTTRRREGQTTQATSSKETVPGGGGGGTVTSSKVTVPGGGGGGTREGWCGCHARAAGGGRGMQRVHSRQPPACAVAPSKTSISLLEDLEKLSAADCTLTYKKKRQNLFVSSWLLLDITRPRRLLSPLLYLLPPRFSLYIYIALLSLWK